MTGYTTEEVARLLGLSPAQIRSYTRAGFLSPSPARAAGGRGELRFSFQDLVLLRAAKGLMAARIPAAKIRSSLRRLKQQLPRGRALSELRITAEGHRVVARDGAPAWYNLGIALEDRRRPNDAVKAYEQAIAADRRLADAYFNLARLYEQAGKKAAALRHLSIYRRLIG